MKGGLFANLPDTGTDEIIEQEESNEEEPKPVKPKDPVMAFIPGAARKRKKASGPSNAKPSGVKVTKLDLPTVDTSDEAKPSLKAPPLPENEVTDEIDDSNSKPDKHVNIQEPISTIRKAPLSAIDSREEEDGSDIEPATVIDDPYDPYQPNDLLEYREQQTLERQRQLAAEERQAAIDAQEKLRKEIEEERRALEDTGDFATVVKHRQERTMGRGRGVVNLPAWLVKQQQEEG